MTPILGVKWGSPQEDGTCPLDDEVPRSPLARAGALAGDLVDETESPVFIQPADAISFPSSPMSIASAGCAAFSPIDMEALRSPKSWRGSGLEILDNERAGFIGIQTGRPRIPPGGAFSLIGFPRRDLRAWTVWHQWGNPRFEALVSVVDRGLCEPGARGKPSRVRGVAPDRKRHLRWDVRQ
jgi:hypothetical protein